MSLLPRAERLVFRESGSSGSFCTHDPDKLRHTRRPIRCDSISRRSMNKDHPTPAVLLVGVANRSVITMADNKNDRLHINALPPFGRGDGTPPELEHADFLLTDHPKAAAALDLLLGTQGWRRFAEQESRRTRRIRTMSHNCCDRTGSVQTPRWRLLKLERQRVNAELFRGWETARLRTVRAHNPWQRRPTQFTVQLSEAAAAVAIAAERLRKRKAQFRISGPLTRGSLMRWGRRCWPSRCWRSSSFCPCSQVGSATSRFDEARLHPVISGENANPTPAPEPKRSVPRGSLPPRWEQL